MQLLRTIPLFFVMLVVYNLMVLMQPETETQPSIMEKTVGTITLKSEAEWTPTYGDIVIMFGLFILYIEILKSTKSTAATVVDHTLSTFVFIAYLIEFLMAKPVAQSTFAILGCMSLVDVLAGFSISIASARRDFQVGGG